MIKIFTRAEINMLKERTRLRKEIKKLDCKLKPLIATAVERFPDMTAGIGQEILEFRHGKDVVRLTVIVSSSVGWKSIAESLADEQEINEVKGLFTVDKITRKAEIV